MSEPSIETSVYEELDRYPWDQDTEFQGGLTAILGSNPPPEQASELTLHARCFYYQRKFNKQINFDDYKAYLQAQHQPQAAPPPQSQASQTSQSQPYTSTPLFNPFPEPTSLPAWTALAATDPPPTNASEIPPGPTLRYQEIVDLIASGKPIPGIKEIPDTVLAGQGTSSTQTRRAKPWEKEGPANGNLELVAGAIKAAKFMNA